MKKQGNVGMGGSRNREKWEEEKVGTGEREKVKK